MTVLLVILAGAFASSLGAHHTGAYTSDFGAGSSQPPR